MTHTTEICFTRKRKEKEKKQKTSGSSITLAANLASLTNQLNEDNLFTPASIGLAYFDIMAHQNQHDNESIKSTISVHIIPPLLID